jgi:ArsR family transcriptional regulator
LIRVFIVSGQSKDSPVSNPDTNHDSVHSVKAESQQESEKEMIATIDALSPSRTGVAFPELSEQLERDLVQVFKLLADETRLKILMYLMREQELHVSALCERLNQSQPAVSHHLALLRVAGLIEPRRDGKHNFYSVREKHFHRLIGELFKTMSDPDRDELRFQNFVLTQEP